MGHKETRVANVSKADLEKLKKTLEKQLKQLQFDLGKDMEEMHSAAMPDINDQASLESERSFGLRIRDRERKLIAKVQETLHRMKEGIYGICESCGEPIGVKRLRARPVTTFCINCKAEMEEEERREESSLQQPENPF